MSWGKGGGWQSGDGGGPWGRPSSGGNGGSGGRDGGDGREGRGGSGGGGNDPSPRFPGGGKAPDFEKLLRSGQDRLKDFLGDNGLPTPKGAALLALGLVFVWLLSGFYVVETNEDGVVTRFGGYHRTATQGLSYHLPYPIESVQLVDVSTINRTELGRTSSVSSRDISEESGLTEEGLMLTADENIVDVQFEVQWKVEDARDFLFNVTNPTLALTTAAESAMREVIGRTRLTQLISPQSGETIRPAIERDVQELLQTILNHYGTGLRVERVNLGKADTPEQVIESYRDVQRAQTDRERARNQAEAYRNEILPKARGEAARQVQDAEAYRQQVVASAEGAASRFSAVYGQYKNARDVTRKRMYLETMEQVLKDMPKIIVDAKSGPGVLPYLPLPQLKPAAGAASGAGSSAAPAVQEEKKP